ncbi:Sterol 3-beta-glucosyltransferase, partial [Mortierella sp. GBA43]
NDSDTHSESEDTAHRTDNLSDNHDVKSSRTSHDDTQNNSQKDRHTSNEFSLGSIHDKDTVAKKLQEAFGYSKEERLIEEYACWMARSVLLPGYMYLTTNHICFYANLPSSHDVVQKDGYFSKKSNTTLSFSRYWFVLKNDVLSYYKDQSNIYYPIKTIDLKDVMSAEPSLTDDFAFTIHTRSRKHKFKTDSEILRTEWVKAIQKSIFHAKTNEDNVKISIPLENVTAVDLASTSFTDTIRLEIMDMDDEKDEFFFAYFDDTLKAQEALKSRLGEYRRTSGRDRDFRYIDSTSSIPGSPRKPLTAAQPQGPLASSISGNQRSVKSQPTSGVSWIFSSLKHLHPFDTSSNSSNGDSSFSLTSPEIGHEDGAIGSGGSLTTGTNMTENGQQMMYSKEFSLPEGESLAETYPGYLLRVLPVYGRIYLSDNYVCFKSTMYGSSTKVVIPLADVKQVDKQHGTRFYFHGLEISTKMGEEIFFDFSSLDTRRTVLKALRSRITPEAQERRKEYRTQAARETISLELDDPMESRVMDSLQLKEEPDEGEPMSLASHPGFKPSRPLHVTCLTIGSRGDVQPYIALCKRLMEDGHSCRIATHGEYKEWVESHGIEFGYVGGDPGELIELCVENGMFTVSFIREGLKKFRSWLDDLMNTAWDACQNTDVLIESPSAMAGIHIAEALDIPYFRALPFPWTRTRTFPHPFAVPERNLGRGYNYMTYAMIEQIFWRGISGQVNRWRRKRLGLPSTTLEKMEADRVPCLYSWSPILVPAPMDWHSWVHVTGYWFLDNPDLDWTPPEGLEEFLNAEPNNKPVYIGFGSMVVSDPDDMTKTIVDAVVKAGVRAVVCKGWSDKSSAQDGGAVTVVQESRGGTKVYPSCVYMIKSVPHDWLFPRVAGVVHHGGAGTTAAGLRAGIPTVIKPYFGDQYFWAQRVEDAGVGVWCRDLTVKKLAAALETITNDQKMIAKAQAMGESIRAEDGVGKAIQYFYHDLVVAKQLLEKRRKDKEKANNENSSTILSKVRAVAASAVAATTGGEGEDRDQRLPADENTTRESKDNSNPNDNERDQQDKRYSVGSTLVAEDNPNAYSTQENDTEPTMPIHPGSFTDRDPSMKSIKEGDKTVVKLPVDRGTIQHQNVPCKEYREHDSAIIDDLGGRENSGLYSSDCGDSDNQEHDGSKGTKKSKAQRVLGNLASKAKMVKDRMSCSGSVDGNAHQEHLNGTNHSDAATKEG